MINKVAIIFIKKKLEKFSKKGFTNWTSCVIIGLPTKNDLKNWRLLNYDTRGIIFAVKVHKILYSKRTIKNETRSYL